MAITRVGGSWIHKYVSLVADDVTHTYTRAAKPELNLPNGSRCFEMDSDTEYIYDRENDAWEVYVPSGGGSGGTTNYNQLSNKPSINNVELSGNKTLAALGIDAGSIGFDETETYDNGSVGKEVSDAKNAISQKAPVIINTASGDVVSFEDGADDMPIKKLVGTIVPVQSGTGDPSPTNVRSINGYTQAKIKASNGNILDLSTAVPYSNATQATVAYNAENDSLYIVGIAAYSGASVKIPVETNTQYTLSVYYTSGNPTSLSVMAQNNSTVITGQGDTSGNRRITLTFNSGANSYIFVRFYASRGNGNRGLTVSEAVLMKGATATYNPIATLPINWETEAGTIYSGSFTLNEDRSVDVVADKAGYDMGSLNWGTGYDDSLFSTTINIMPIIMGQQFDGWIYCSCFKPMYGSTLGSIGMNIKNGQLMGRNTYRELYIKDTRFTTTEEFKASVAGQTLVIPLENPITYHFDNIGELYTYLGTNNVWIDTGAITECDYPADTKLYIDGLTAPDEDMIANANIASGKYFVVNNQLYLSTAAIAAGASIVPGTNCTATNIAEALNTINT